MGGCLRGIGGTASGHLLGGRGAASGGMAWRGSRGVGDRIPSTVNSSGTCGEPVGNLWGTSGKPGNNRGFRRYETPGKPWNNRGSVGFSLGWLQEGGGRHRGGLSSEMFHGQSLRGASVSARRSLEQTRRSARQRWWGRQLRHSWTKGSGSGEEPGHS